MNIQDKNLFYIGGIVRDEILGIPSFDIDLTYNGNAIEFVKNLDNIQILQVNEPFGTVRIKLDDKEIDIASTRSESYPQKGHLPVIDKIGCSLKEDVLRRDFTINALAKSTLTGEIIDYTGGLEDINKKIIRILHENSFIDDPTRILRALKFSVRFGFELDEHTKKLQDNYLSDINYDMSYKRLKKELSETFNLNKWSAYERFISQGIYKLIAPEQFEIPQYNFSSLIETFKPQNIWIIYIGLLPNISNLPLTKSEKQIVENFNNLKNINPKNDFEIYKTFENIPTESVIMYSTIDSTVVERYFYNLKDIDITINGNDLKNLGIKPSPKYQQCFDYILEKKILNPELTVKDEINIAKEFFKLY